MTRLGTPVALRWGSCDPAAPLIVLFHGRNATETDMAWRAPYLPDGAAYASVRAPLAEGRGFAWFANGGTGRPLPDSLAVTMAWFREWLDERATIGPRRGGLASATARSSPVGCCWPTQRVSLRPGCCTARCPLMRVSR